MDRHVGVAARTGVDRLKQGSDAVGIGLGLLTIPMALLSAGGIVAGVVLAMRHDWSAIVIGTAAFLLCSILARLLEQLVIRIDDVAAGALGRRDRSVARIVAVVSGALPMIVILASELVCLRGVQAYASTGTAFAVWLWGYGVATGPWTLFADRVSRFRRTLVAVRAYAGHIALWLFSVLALVLHVSPGVAVAVMVLPAALPFVIGMLLALADRDAIANVRV